jgi:hypothetical protein
MALKQCAGCGNTFWSEPEVKLCVICRVVEQHRQTVEKEKAAAKKERQRLEMAVS